MTRKEREWAGIFQSPSGMPGVEMALRLMLTAVSQGRLDLSAVSRLLSGNPARVYGLYPRKGVIAVGAGADIAVVDTGRRWTVDISSLGTKAKASASITRALPWPGVPLPPCSGAGYHEGPGAPGKARDGGLAPGCPRWQSLEVGVNGPAGSGTASCRGPRNDRRPAGGAYGSWRRGRTALAGPLSQVGFS
ncbi:MAG: amidohydrolase family protein [Bacillota bacterium]